MDAPGTGPSQEHVSTLHFRLPSVRAGLTSQSAVDAEIGQQLGGVDKIYAVDADDSKFTAAYRFGDLLRAQPQEVGRLLDSHCPWETREAHDIDTRPRVSRAP